ESLHGTIPTSGVFATPSEAASFPRTRNSALSRLDFGSRTFSRFSPPPQSPPFRVKTFGSVSLTVADGRELDFAVILLPVALLILVASVRYAFRPVGAPGISKLTSSTARVIRDWSPLAGRAKAAQDGF